MSEYQPCVSLRARVGDESYYAIVEGNLDNIWTDSRYDAITQQYSLQWEPSSGPIGDADSILLEDVPIARHELVEEIGRRIAVEICRNP